MKSSWFVTMSKYKILVRSCAFRRQRSAIKNFPNKLVNGCFVIAIRFSAKQSFEHQEIASAKSASQ